MCVCVLFFQVKVQALSLEKKQSFLMINYAFKRLVKSLPGPGKCHSESQCLRVHIQIRSSNTSDVAFPVASGRKETQCVCQQTSPKQKEIRISCWRLEWQVCLASHSSSWLALAQARRKETLTTNHQGSGPAVGTDTFPLMPNPKFRGHQTQF